MAKPGYVAPDHIFQVKNARRVVKITSITAFIFAILGVIVGGASFAANPLCYYLYICNINTALSVTSVSVFSASLLIGNLAALIVGCRKNPVRSHYGTITAIVIFGIVVYAGFLPANIYMSAFASQSAIVCAMFEACFAVLEIALLVRFLNDLNDGLTLLFFFSAPLYTICSVCIV